MDKILFADDEQKYRKLVEIFLKKQGYEVLTASNGEELLDLFFANPNCKLVILDVMMPLMDGWETCKIIREKSNVPILMLTALSDVSNEIKGLKYGADDYVNKPFSNDLLTARVDAIIRRNKTDEQVRFLRYGIELDDRSNTIVYENQVYKLTYKEFLLFRRLLDHADQVLLRDHLISHVWGYDYEGDPRTLDTHIKSLRAKLGTLSDHIVTVRGKGYYFRSSQ